MPHHGSVPGETLVSADVLKHGWLGSATSSCAWCVAPAEVCHPS